ncbi:hypothetical protein ABZ312_40995 [Streptomyces sp. NPDC006207]
MTDHRVLLVGRARDAEHSRLAEDLHRAGIPWTRLNVDELEAVKCTVDLATRTITFGDVSFLPTVTWIRHFSMRATSAQGDDTAATMLRDDSWEALVAQLAALSRTTIGLDAPGQLRQLTDAARLGTRVPRTTVTTDVAEALRSAADRKVVVKTVDRHYVEPLPGQFSWFHPQLFPPGRTPSAAALPHGVPTLAQDGLPVVVQEYVPHRTEIRLYLVGTRAHAFTVRKHEPSDIWLRPETVRVRQVEPPADVLDTVRRLAELWNLRYGAFDFLIDDAGPVFLEMNAHGDWRWYERQAGVDDVSRAVSHLVASLHRSAGGDDGAFDLLTFLSARRT